MGGHCLPKDSWLLKYGLDTYGSIKFDPEIITRSRYLNDSMPQHMKQLTEEALAEKGLKIRDARITILGVAFLENSDDTRNTPAEPIYKALVGNCAEVIAHDPYVKEFEDLHITNDLEKAIEGSDCLIVVTCHKQYQSLKPDVLKTKMRTPIIINGRNIFNQNECLSKGFSFSGIGLPVKKNG